MAITFVGAGTASSLNTSGDVSPVPNASTLIDDLMILVQHRNDELGTFDAVTGFTEIHQEAPTTGQDRSTGLWYRVATADAPGAVTCGHSDAGTEQYSAQIMTFRGVDTTTPLDVTFAAGTHRVNRVNKASPNVDAFQAITTVTDGAFVLAIEMVTHDDITSNADPTNYTNAYRLIGTSPTHQHRQQQAWYREIATAGAETPGAPAYTSSLLTAESTQYTIALRPASTGTAYSVTVDLGTYTQGGLDPTLSFVSVAPSITTVDGGAETVDTRTAVTLAGTNFEAVQGTGKVEISPTSTYATLTEVEVNTWSDTSLSIDMHEITTTNPLDDDFTLPGTVYVWVTNDAGGRNAAGFALTLKPAGATWLAAEDADYDGVALDTPFRVRHRLSVSAVDWTTPTVEIWGSKNAGAYFQVTTTSTGGVQLTNSASPYVVDGDDITEALLSGSGSLIANNNGQVESSAEISGGATVTNGNFIETEHVLKFPTGDAVNGDAFRFRLRDGSGVEFTGTYVDVVVTVNAGFAAYTLTCDAGAYTHGGLDPTITAQLSQAVDLGAYTQAGLDATISVGYGATLDLGTYTHGGLDPTVTVQRTQAVDLGTYTHGGLDPTVTVQRTQAVDLGTYTYGGLDPALARGRLVTVDLGTYTYAGLDPTTSNQWNPTVDLGTYTHTGLDAALAHSFGITITLDAGTYTYSGLDPDLVAGLQISLEAGVYTYTGLDPDLVDTATLFTETGVYTHTGLDPDLTAQLKLTLDAGAYSLTGFDPTLSYAEASDDAITSSGRVSAGTSWNKDWAKDYGPDAARARAAEKKQVQNAITTLSRAPEIAPIAEAQAIAKRSLPTELMGKSADKMTVMLAYYEYLRWQRRKRADDERAAELLLLL